MASKVMSINTIQDDDNWLLCNKYVDLRNKDRVNEVKSCDSRSRRLPSPKNVVKISAIQPHVLVHDTSALNRAEPEQNFQ